MFLARAGEAFTQMDMLSLHVLHHGLYLSDSQIIDYSDAKGMHRLVNYTTRGRGHLQRIESLQPCDQILSK